MRRGSVLLLAMGGAVGYAAARKSVAKRRVRLDSPGRHVVILGGGFGGLSAASKLVSLAGDQLRITLIDQHNYHLFTPMLYQVATCGVVPYDVAIPLRTFTSPRGIRFRKGCVQDIDLERQLVRTDTGEIDYDCLIIALGSTTNYFGNASAQQHSMPLKSLEAGLAIRNRVIDALEKAALTSDMEKRRALLTFVIIGGGATGVETAGALADAVRHLIPKNYPALDAHIARVILMESAGKLLGHMSAEMAELAMRELHSAGVEVWLNTAAKNVYTDRVETANGRSVITENVLWATGVCAPDLVGKLPIRHGTDGAIAVNEFLQVPAHPNVFAIGDNAEALSQESSVPLLAAAAMQQGFAAGANVVRMFSGRSLQPFRYKNLGSVVSVGHRAGVAELRGRSLEGLPDGLPGAWYTWPASRASATKWPRHWIGRLGTFMTSIRLDWK